jgi:hypothetical protein
VKPLSLNKDGLGKKGKIIGKAKYNDQWARRSIMINEQLRFDLEGIF